MTKNYKLSLFPNEPIKKISIDGNYNTEYDNNNTKNATRIITLHYESCKVKISAVEDYYTFARFLFPHKKSKLDKIVGKICVDIKKVKKFEINKNLTQIKYYNLIFSDGMKFPVMFVNTSDSYYGGYVDIETIHKSPGKKYNKINLTIIIGLPGSGKTKMINNFKKDINLLNSNSKFSDGIPESVKVLDDVLSDIFDKELINAINLSNKNIIISDPRLCDKQIFEKIKNKIKKYIPKENVKLVLFENDYNACLKNILSKTNTTNKKNSIEKSLSILTKIYNPKNKVYNYYKNEIIPCYVMKS